MYKDVLFYSNDWCEVFLDNKLWLTCASSCNILKRGKKPEWANYIVHGRITIDSKKRVCDVNGRELVTFIFLLIFCAKKSTKRKSRKCWHKLLITLIYRCSNVKHRMLVKKKCRLERPLHFLYLLYDSTPCM